MLAHTLDEAGRYVELSKSHLAILPDLPERPDENTVFLKLRELRNSW